MANGPTFESKITMRPTRNILFICILVLFGCERVYVRTYPEKTYPSKPSPTISSAAEIPQERPSKVKSLPSRTYTEEVSKWKSYQDLVRWFEKEFSLDVDRFNKFEQTLPPPQTPEETFRRKSGIYVDAATFAKETLNRIDPSYKARIVIIIFRPYGYNHYVCSFKKDGKIFIIDYGTPYTVMTGVHGPFNALGEYRKFYENHHSIKKHIEAVRFLQ